MLFVLNENTPSLIVASILLMVSERTEYSLCVCGACSWDGTHCVCDTLTFDSLRSRDALL